MDARLVAEAFMHVNDRHQGRRQVLRQVLALYTGDANLEGHNSGHSWNQFLELGG